MKKQTKLIDIAKVAGVDVSTVSLSLNNSPKVAVKTKQRIQKLAASMNYHPNIMAQALRSGKSKTVGILLPMLGHPFFNRMLQSIEHYFFTNNYASMVSVIRSQEYRRIVNNLSQRNVDGICFGFPDLTHPDAVSIYKNFISNGKPISFYIEKSLLPLMESVDANFAVCDMTAGTRTIFEHLLQLNHRRIALVGQIDDRVQDSLKFMQEENLPIDDLLIIHSWGQGKTLSQKLMEMLNMDNPPTAIFSHSDDLSVRIMKILLENGVRIPDDISLISINDDPFSGMLQVPLTTLQIPVHQIGTAMADMLLNQIKAPDIKPEIRYFDTKLVLRDSLSPKK